jgi:hypothetical protein
MLPSGVSESEIPAAVTSVDEGLVEIVTEDELRVLHTLTGWALEHGYVLKGLAVVRVTLEDIYLKLTRQAIDSNEGQRR